MKKLLLKLKSALGCIYRGFKDAMRSWDTRIRCRYAYYYKHCRIREDLVLYEAYFGKGTLCNPYAIFLELLNDPQYAHLHHVWVLENPDSCRELQEAYKNDARVTFVKRHSGPYLKYLCTAKYLINNVTFHNYFIKREGQVYVNTWHGIPLKTLGFDMPNGGVETSNVIRNFLQTDYMISASPFLTEIYKKAYKLEELYNGKIIQEGYPRLDLLTRFDREQILAKLRSYGVEVDSNKKILLFAPTWRGTSYAQASSDVQFYFDFKETLEKTIDTSEYQILIKVHQRVYELAHKKLTAGYFIPSMIDANEVLAVTDILVSDFSSIYIDFLATGRPVLFYIPDLESYSTERGLYRSPDHLPGPCTGDPRQIAQWVTEIQAVWEQYRDKYEVERAWSNGYGAGTISKKIVDIVFAGHEEGYCIVKQEKKKTHLLISRGKMLVNGISTSMLSLLENIDYDRFDVSVMILPPNNDQERRLVDRIDPRARVLCRNSPGSYTVGEWMTRHYYDRNGVKNPFHAMYQRDVRRSYGNAEFDAVVDFEGYNTYYSILCLQFPKAHKCIWQHNDMLQEHDAKYPWLKQIFELYRHYDRVVSCAYDVMVVNREKLSPWCGPEKFGYMKNFIDIRRIQASLGGADIREYDGKPYYACSERNHGGCLSLRLMPCIPKYNENMERNYRFITVGRSSMEKNHENLLRAFADLREQYHNVYLYLLGDGKLKDKTDGLIRSLGLSDHAFAPGNIANPFAILENCDCFILPSLHEGQPMVINEARVLKMPIIVSEFSSVRGILVDNGQLTIGTEVEDIRTGMEAFLQGRVPTAYEFDAQVYNRQAYQEFLTAIGME